MDICVTTPNICTCYLLYNTIILGDRFVVQHNASVDPGDTPRHRPSQETKRVQQYPE